MHWSNIIYNWRNEKDIWFHFVDRNNDGSGSLKRYKKKSFDWYKKVIESNGEVL